MATAIYSGAGWVLKIRQTGTLLLRGEPTEVTDQEVEILRGHPDVAVEEAAGPPAASAPKRDWVAYAKAHGVEDADGLTKADIVERLG